MHKVQLVLKEPLDHKETLDPQVYKELREQLDILALKEHSDQQEDKVLREERVIQVHKEQQVQPDLKVVQVLKGL